MNSYNLYYFKKSDSISANDLNLGSHEMDIINLNLISSISSIIDFNMPLSGNFVGKYAIVTMNNKDKYFIKPSAHEDLCKRIKA